MIDQLILCGATGDLTARKLLPALAELAAAGRLPDGFAILGMAREAWDTERFRRHLWEAVARYAPGIDRALRDALATRSEFRRADVTDPGQVAAALELVRGPAVAYLALPPGVFAPAVRALASARLPAGSRVVVEKPFGSDLASARALNRLLLEGFPERSVFRIDHFLHKQTVQNILGLRFANRAFEALWHRDHIERVDIVWDETLTVEGRAGYYDRAGALKDMIQNHLLQLVSLVGMEAPAAWNERDLRDRKVDVLHAVRRLAPDEVRDHTVRARYAAGRIGARVVPAYVEEPGIDPARGTETFARVTLWIENDRWSGVPFLLRTGKALARNRREIAVHFRPVPYRAFATQAPPPNVLRFEIDPDRIAFGINLNGTGDPFDLERVALDAAFPPQELPAYARLLLDVLAGDSTLSIRADEAEEAWRIVEPILDAWRNDAIPLREYPAGSSGPDAPLPT